MTIEEAKAAFKGKNGVYYKLSDLAASVKEQYPIYSDVVLVRQELKKIYDHNINLFGHKARTQQYSLKKIRPVGPLPVSMTREAESSFIGTAGEMAVAGELLFQGYGVSRPVVDTGVDIIANKKSNVFFIQVKTSCYNGSASFTIKKTSYDRQAQNYVRYVLVIRCGDGEMRYFTLSQDMIDNLIRRNVITDGRNDFSITIKYDQQSHRPYLSRGNNTEDIYDYRGIKI